MSDYDKKILFLGNSYIYFNDLPDMLEKLALSGGYNLYVDQVTRGGASLLDFLNEDDELNLKMERKLVEQKWDNIVLQEQSQNPAVPDKRYEKMYPGIRLLNKKIKSLGAGTVLYMTWGRQFGDRENGFEDFESMQEALTEGYTKIAEEVSALLVPVGIAWSKARQKNRDIELWVKDGSHPTVKGTYLTACVFYAVLLKQSPVGLSFTSGISHEEAKFLQETAFESINSCE